MPDKPVLRIGLIGTGFMGECHALAFTAVQPLFQPQLRPRLQVVADINTAAAERARARFGFACATGDWRELVAMVTLVIAPRPAAPAVDRQVAGTPHRTVALPMMGESSTDIRELLAAGQSIEGLVPPAVAGYIERHHLYQPPDGGAPTRS